MLAWYRIALSTVVCSVCCLSSALAQEVDWPVYLGGKERNLYSPLDQINLSNVGRLKVAWIYETGNQAEYQANNLILVECSTRPLRRARSLPLTPLPAKRFGSGIRLKNIPAQAALGSEVLFTGRMRAAANVGSLRA